MTTSKGQKLSEFEIEKILGKPIKPTSSPEKHWVAHLSFEEIREPHQKEFS
ncbi:MULTISPECIES: hypothetical protein [Roseivirga]|uniref:hypothetical protein n=1 Tax=Roseivirga TaxID=290180 RepID=UPI00257C9E81|nr:MULTISPECIES: hypothetical protein [Roseivirga]|tara:strand:- start:27451 stop:27603 length:153 start_codon:yes stop_codon:yes gene_type:complete